MPVPSNQIKVTLLFYPSGWYICDFFLFHIEIEGKCGWIIGGREVGGPKGMLDPLSNYWRGATPPPPLSYPYEAPEQQNNGHQT